MKLKYYSFSKRKNSTAQPTGGTEIDVVLKEPCSILNPTFKTFTDVKLATYVYIADWGRYYFVDDITYDGPEYVMTCSVDALASHKTAIGSTYADVEYTSSSSNILIYDPRNQPTAQIDEALSAVFDLTSYGFATTPSTYIVGTMTDDGLKYCVMTASDLKTVISTIYSTDFFQSISNVIYDMKNVIVSCIAIPYTPTKTVVVGGLAVDSNLLLSDAYYVAEPNRLVHVLQGVS